MLFMLTFMKIIPLRKGFQKGCWVPASLHSPAKKTPGSVGIQRLFQLNPKSPILVYWGSLKMSYSITVMEDQTLLAAQLPRSEHPELLEAQTPIVHFRGHQIVRYRLQ